MATSLYSTSLRLALPTTGDLFGTWGTEINNSITQMLDQAVAGRAVVNMASDANYTLTALNGTSDEARCAVLRVVSGVSLTTTRNVVVPLVPKMWLVENATTGSQSIQVIAASGTGVTIPNGSTYWVRCDGTNVVASFGYFPASLGTALLPSYTFIGDQDTGVYSPGANEWAVATAGVQRLAVDGSGNVGVGVTPVTSVNASFGKNITGATTAYGVRVTGEVRSDVTFTANLYNTSPTTQATAFTLTNLRHYHAQNVTVGGGAAVTNQFGFMAADLSSATNNYGFRGLLSAGTNKWNLYMEGDAKNYLEGRVLIGTATENASGAKLQTSDGITFPATAVASADANTLDDYEEGTFTPISQGASVAGTGTYSFQYGRYTKIGNIVYIELTVVWTAHTGTGQLQIAGLPFPTKSGTNSSAIFTTWGTGFTMSANTQLLVGNMTSSATAVGVREWPLAGGTPAGISVSATGNISVSGMYRTD